MCVLVETLKKKIPKEAIASKCAKQGCKVSLKRAPSPHLVVNVDHPFFGLVEQNRCDFLFVCCRSGKEANWAVPLELKRGSPNATEMVNQLQAGSVFAQIWIPSEQKTHFLPVGVYGGNLKTFDRNRLRKARILFRGKKYEIKLIRCGTSLNAALP